MSSAICFNLDQSKMLSFAKGLMSKATYDTNPMHRGPRAMTYYLRLCTSENKVTLPF